MRIAFNNFGNVVSCLLSLLTLILNCDEGGSAAVTTMSKSPRLVEQYTGDIPWWSGNTRLTDFLSRLLGTHVAHADLIVFWAGAMALFGLSRWSVN